MNGLQTILVKFQVLFSPKSNKKQFRMLSATILHFKGLYCLAENSDETSLHLFS